MSTTVIQATMKVIPGIPKNSYVNLTVPIGYVEWDDHGTPTLAIWFAGLTHNYLETGPIKVVLWAVPNYNEEPSWNGFIMGEKWFESLHFGQSHSDKSFNVPFNKPPPGDYSVIIAVEVQGRMMTHRTYPHKRRFHPNGRTHLIT